MRPARTLLCASAIALLWSSTAGAQTLYVPHRNESLKLVRHDVWLDIQHPVATTVVTQEFANPHNVSLEAFFSYPVPPDATVTGLALWVNGERREARLLERQRAREIYQGIVNQKRDPALLEKTSEGFRIRIFPVLPRAKQRVELRFVQPVTVDSDGSYRLTLRRPPGSTIHGLRLSARLRAGFPLRRAWLEGCGDAELAWREGAHALAPTAVARFDREIHLRYEPAEPLDRPRAASAEADGEQLFVAELSRRPSRVAPRQVALLVDTSTSMARHLPVARRLARALLDHLGAADRLALVPFGLLPAGPVAPAPVTAELRSRARATLAALAPHGGTAFAPAFRRALAAGVDHLVCITDGGTVYHRAELEQLLGLLLPRQDVAVSVVALPGAVNEEALTDLTAASGGLFRTVDPASEANLEALAAQLARHARPGVRVAGRGQAFLLRVDADRVLVTGAVPAAATAVELELVPGRERVALELTEPSAEPAALHGVLGAAAIAKRMREIKLLGEDEPRRGAVVALSLRHHVVSEYTALLATETDADYARPTSGQKWQRQPAPNIGDNLPPAQLNPTPEPHEWALIGLGLALLLWARRRGWIPHPPRLRGQGAATSST
jgi:Mg-chelatase subunit ChlD